DQALLRIMQKFDRILDREDVAVFVLVDVVDHRRERRRLARSRWPGDQNQSARTFSKRRKRLRRAEILEREHLRRNRPKRRSGAALLVEGVDAKAGQVRNGEAEVALQRFFVMLAL